MRKRRTAYEIWQDRLLTEIFAEAEGLWMWSLPELAAEAGLATSTVYKLYHRETKWVRSTTLFALCEAIGMDLQLVRREEAKAAAAA